MNIYKAIEKEVRAALEALQQAGELPAVALPARIEVSPPRDPSHGDVATNAAMALAGAMSMKPQDIAAKLAQRLAEADGVAAVNVAGAGFVNLTLKPEVWRGMIPEILRLGMGYGGSNIGQGQHVNVEYVSANPTGPMHVGHARGAVVGDALALLLLKAGYQVTKEYYINDGGAQVDKLAESAHLRYRESLGEAIGDIPEGLYPGDYLVPVGEALAREYGRKLLTMDRAVWLPIVRSYAIDAMMTLIKSDLEVMGVQHDIYVSERKLAESGRVDEAVRLLDGKGLIYTGVLEPPKGKAPEDWEPRPQTLFRATQFGDDTDRPIRKSDGSWTYFAPDIAYHLDKIRRGHLMLVNVFGADHGGYVKRLQAAVRALSDGKATLDVKLCQLVKFMRGGQPAKMSKRAGTFVTVREVVDEVGRDVLRFIMLTRKNDAPLEFDFAKVMEQSKDNPVFYVQYAHARARSVMRHAAADMPRAYQMAQKPDAEVLAQLAHPEELALIKHMAAWPRMVESAAAACEPHRIAFALQDLAAAFHGFWNLGNEDASLRFLVPGNDRLTAARVALADALSLVIASGLMVLGVKPLEELR